MRWSKHSGWKVEMHELAGLEEDIASGRMLLDLIAVDGREGRELTWTERQQKLAIGTYPAGIVVRTDYGFDSDLFLAYHPNLVEYDGKYLTIYKTGKREPNEEELLFQKNWLKWGEDFMNENPGVSIYTLADHKNKFLLKYGYSYEEWIRLIAGKSFNKFDFRIYDSSVKDGVHAKYAVSFLNENLVNNNSQSELLNRLRTVWKDILAESRRSA